MIHRFVVLAGQLLLVLAALFAADITQRHIDIIPRWLLRLPVVDYSRDDFWTTVIYFIVIHAVVLLLASLLLGAWSPGRTRRTVDELFVLGVAFAVSAMAVFVTTTVAFDPQFMVGTALWVVILTLLVHWVRRLAVDHESWELGGFFKALFRRSFSIPGIIAIVLALSPGVLAKLFVSNRDVANVITQIRIRLASDDDGQWSLVNALGDVKFQQPIQVAFPPSADHMYVLERAGQLYRVGWPKAGEKKLVLDIAASVGYVEVENGALGFALHPQFESNDSDQFRTLFLYYTSVIEGEQVNRLSRFRLGEDIAGAEEILIEWDRNNDGFHNGGGVLFGPDGFLYVAVGEMSNRDSHQRIDETLAGGVLRIDVDKRGGDISRPIARQQKDGSNKGYYIPVDNPFAGQPDVLAEFWAIGLRNPFRISFDSANDSLWAGDVGSAVWEEVNRVEKGGNYQFPYFEGREQARKVVPESMLGTQHGPIYTYRHTAYDRAVIGGVVYRGRRFPELDGKYVFGDNYSGKIFALQATPKEVDQVALLTRANQFAQRGITSFALSPDGHLLVTTMGKSSEPTGEVLRFERGADMSSQPASTAGNEVVSVAEATNLYQTNCARCHGREGRADGPDSKSMDVPVPDMSSAVFQDGRTDEQLHAVIELGGVQQGKSAMMPPWGELLSDAEIKAIVTLIRGFDAR